MRQLVLKKIQFHHRSTLFLWQSMRRILRSTSSQASLFQLCWNRFIWANINDLHALKNNNWCYQRNCLCL